MSTVLNIAIPTPLYRVFDYRPPPAFDVSILQPGQRVAVPFGRGQAIGILLSLADSSEIEPSRLRPAVAILDREPLLGRDDLRLLVWASRYYHHPVGEVIASSLPVLLRKGEDTAPPPRLIAEPANDAQPPPALTRAPRQAQLLSRLQESADGLSAAELRSVDADYSAAARALITKGLARWVTGPAVSPVRYSIPATDRLASAHLNLNPHQSAAVEMLTQALGRFQVFLLDGVTGSGKTEVYLQLAAEVLARGQQVIVLLPEINLTPQLESRFRARLDARVAIFHSGLADSERRCAWLGLQNGQISILLGTRSAAFIPAPALGLIILDEEHDASFKQQEGFRFSARDVAVMRANFGDVPVVLGSATPSLESLHNVRQQRYQRLELPLRAGNAAPPRFRVIDLRAQRLQEGISAQLSGEITQTLARGEQALLFVNRRGYAPTLICHDCGWVAPCRRCDTHLVIHAGDRRLRCHHCGLDERLPTACPACGKTDLQALGLGTERVEAALIEMFPTARVARIDRDSTRRKGSLQRLLAAIHDNRINILIGTQMLAKGHHFPGVTLVGMLDVDAGLFSTDFRASERTAQLIVQVAGRAGREDKPGTVILQTRHPDHPLLQRLVRRGYPDFASACLAERQAAALPPYSHQALWRAEATDSSAAMGFLNDLAALAHTLALGALLVLGPAPAPLARRGNRYRWQLLMQSDQRSILHSAIDQMLQSATGRATPRSIRWSVDVDPVDLF